MKIECTIENYFKTYNEAKGVVLSKKKILKSKSPKCLNYLTRNIIVILLIIVLAVLIPFTTNICLISLIYILILLEVITISLAITNYVTLYLYRKKRNFKSIITLNKEGLTDTSFQGIKMIFSWDKIKGIVIKKYSITILTDTSCFFYLDIRNKKDIEKALDKYASKDLIIK